MIKKLTLLGMAITAVAAFAMPTTASASPRLMEGSTAVSTGATIVATSKNAKITNTALGTVECKTWTFREEVEKNTGFEIETSGYGETFACSAGGKAATVTFQTLALFTAIGWEDSGLAYPWIQVDVGPFGCEYVGVGPFTYTTGNDVVSINANNIGSTVEICEPEEGFPVFEGDFTLTTESGVPVTIK